MLKSFFGNVRCLLHIYCVDVWQRLSSNEIIYILIFLNILFSMITVLVSINSVKLLKYYWNCLRRWVYYWESLGNGWRQMQKWLEMAWKGHKKGGKRVQNAMKCLQNGCKHQECRWDAAKQEQNAKKLAEIGQKLCKMTWGSGKWPKCPIIFAYFFLILCYGMAWLWGSRCSNVCRVNI